MKVEHSRELSSPPRATTLLTIAAFPSQGGRKNKCWGGGETAFILSLAYRLVLWGGEEGKTSATVRKQGFCFVY